MPTHQLEGPDVLVDGPKGTRPPPRHPAGQDTRRDTATAHWRKDGREVVPDVARGTGLSVALMFRMTDEVEAMAAMPTGTH